MERVIIIPDLLLCTRGNSYFPPRQLQNPRREPLQGMAASAPALIAARHGDAAFPRLWLIRNRVPSPCYLQMGFLSVFLTNSLEPLNYYNNSLLFAGVEVSFLAFLGSFHFLSWRLLFWEAAVQAHQGCFCCCSCVLLSSSSLCVFSIPHCHFPPHLPRLTQAYQGYNQNKVN